MRKTRPSPVLDLDEDAVGIANKIDQMGLPHHLDHLSALLLGLLAESSFVPNLQTEMVDAGIRGKGP